MNLAVFITRHVPHDKVNVIGDGSGLEAPLGLHEPIEGFAQSVQIFA